MSTLLITGANGQLGRQLRRLLDGDQRFTATFTDVDELDITNGEAVNSMVSAVAPDYIVNCAAYTAVDHAKDDEQQAMDINCNAVALLARAAASCGARMLHISTDYVFDGMACRPYREDDTPHPVTAYGRTKLAGERVLQELLPDSMVILRTAWLYSPHGKNFVKTMLELGRTRQSLRVVYDQVGSPTSAADLAQAIITVLTAHQWHPGIYNYTNEGAISWYDFALAIHRLAGITTCEVRPCLSHEYPAQAQRPHYSVLDKAKFKQTFGVTVPHWHESLAQLINDLDL